MDNNGTLYVHAMQEMMRNQSKESSGGTIYVFCGINEKMVDSTCLDKAVEFGAEKGVIEGSASVFEKRLYKEGDCICFPQAENGLHYVHQIDLAKKIVHAVACYDVSVFLTTYSTIMLRAIEVIGEDEPLLGKSRIHYYLLGEDGSFHCVDGETNKIYHEFYLPFEEL